MNEQMNSLLDKLQPYPFERLSALLEGVTPPSKKAILWSIGEPKHQAPDFIARIINEEISGLSSYPLTIGEADLRQAICEWLINRFHLPENSLDINKNVLPCNGSREALFAFVQAVVDRAGNLKSEAPLVLMPNPFYQIYEGAALLAGAEPYFVNVGDNLLPDYESIDEDIWRRCQLLIVCSPGNPTGAVTPPDTMRKLIALSQKHNFILASDECYSELYPDEKSPPAGLLEVAAESGLTDFNNCAVFHSLSKRSNLPGMRSGFIAGDARIMQKFKLYRTYHGCAMSPPFQRASAAAWRDEEHVRANRQLYRQKFKAVLDIIKPVVKVEPAQGAFYLWPETPGSDTDFTRNLFKHENITVVPGSYLSRQAHGQNPGAGRIRMALVAPLDECIEGARRLADFVGKIKN
jgi:N-succinyldiaminopimelate aminotransferase